MGEKIELLPISGFPGYEITKGGQILSKKQNPKGRWLCLFSNDREYIEIK